MAKLPKRESIERGLAMACLLGLGIFYGVLAYPLKWFPVPQIRQGISAVEEVAGLAKPRWYFNLPDRQPAVIGTAAAPLADGLVMVVGMTDGPKHFIRVIDRAGKIVHQWQPDWFEIWSDSAGNYPKERRPNTQPGSVLHGAAIAGNGDVVFNFENLSTVRLSPCGELRWKLQNYGHHTIFIDEDGAIWTPAEVAVDADPVRHQNHLAPTLDLTVDKLSPDGEILESTSAIDILRQNDLLGLLHLSSLKNPDTPVLGDTLHLNDIDIFPQDLTSTVFAPGDIMISLRNIATILVMDPGTHRIKWRMTGEFLRQHDPDFIGGDRILLFDNRNLSPSAGPEAPASRILEIDAATKSVQVRFSGTGTAAFFSNIMGKQQLQPNGNVLITSAMEGRAIELAPDGTLLWEYLNVLEDGKMALLTQAEILPQFMDRKFFEDLAAACPATPEG